MSKVKPLNPNKRRIVSNSVTVSAQIDNGFIHLKIPKTLTEKKKNPEGPSKILDYKFVMIIDLLSRYIYCEALSKIDKHTLKNALDTLFKGPEKMPRFV